jgi:hypothetical protein
MTNCICACEECNGQRGDMPAEEFAKLMNRPAPLPSLVQVGRHLTAGAAALADEPEELAEPMEAPAEPAAVRFESLTRLLDAAPVSRRLLY